MHMTTILKALTVHQIKTKVLVGYTDIKFLKENHLMLTNNTYTVYFSLGFNVLFYIKYTLRMRDIKESIWEVYEQS